MHAGVDVGDHDALAARAVLRPHLVGLDVLHAPLGRPVARVGGSGGRQLSVVHVVRLSLDDLLHVAALRQLGDQLGVTRDLDGVGDPVVLVADLLLVQEQNVAS
ncbi:hypothetical protein GCM10025734_04650 [Kitasatospora paranensis]